MIGFRLDANESIATGHMMRCIAIAKECRKQGQDSVFLLAEDKETERLRQQGLRYRILHTAWDDLPRELPVLNTVIREERLDYLVVDTYQATPEYLQTLNAAVPVMYLDDMAEVSYETDAVLHYGIWPEPEQYRMRYQTLETRVLAGMEYIPLREEFQPGRESAAKQTGRSGRGSGEAFQPERESAEGTDRKRQEAVTAAESRRIMITTGGTDPYDVTGAILRRCMKEPAFQEYSFDVIVGSMNQYADALRKLARGEERICLHQNVQRMSRLMRGAGMAVSAGGTTLYELCACGTPTVCFVFADNQLSTSVWMGRKNIMPYAGDARQTDVAGAAVKQLALWIQDPTVCRQYGERMRQIVDGMGAVRIAAFLCGRIRETEAFRQ